MYRDKDEICEGCELDVGDCACDYCIKCNENIDLGLCECIKEEE